MRDEIGRVMQEEVAADRRWHLPAVYETENRRIEDWLKNKAREVLASRNPTLHGALAATETHAMTVGALFARRSEYRDLVLLEKARLGLFAREAPSRFAKILFVFLTILSAVLEVGIFVAMYLVDESNMFVITTGIILALGGWLIGFGAGNLAGYRDEEDQGAKSSKMYIWFIIGGVVLVGGMAYVRSSGGGSDTALVVVFTTLIALCVALFEALATWTSNKYRDRLDKMFLCQAWYAEERHIENAASELWRKIYESEVRRLMSEGGEALRDQGAPE